MQGPAFARLPSFAGAHASLGFASLRGRFAALRAARRPTESASLPMACGHAALGVAAWLAAAGAAAGPADVLAAKAGCDASTCTFTVTVRHADTGWDHYANRFEVVGPDGKVIATRVLRHPHIQEQPVTRTLEGVRVPEGVERVRIRAGDLRHGLGGAEVDVKIER